MKRIFYLLAAAVVAGMFSFRASAQDPMEAMMQPLPNDPAVRTGKLDNGLTYYIRHNELPASRAEFYLATNVGAIQETPDQDGLAHFLEHMCFNGTEHFPDKGILNYLQSIGAEFGRNINASTGFEETQYMLNNIPVERESVVDSCLMILREYSHYVLNEPEEIDKERGVILEERRMRRNAEWRLFERSLPYYFGDCKYARCTLIGSEENLKTFKPESLHNFYHTWYHPDMQAVVVVGDVDVDRTEAKIKELFSEIPYVETRAKEVITVPGHAEPVIGVLTDPEKSTASIEMIWGGEAAPEAYNNTIIGVMQDALKDLIGQIMDERFEDITSKPDAPYLSGSVSIGQAIYESIEAVMGEVTLKEDNILGGFRAFYTEIEKMKRFGFSDDEFSRAKTNLLTSYENQVKKADTRKNPELVRPLLRNFFDNEAFMEPQAKYELVTQVLAQINAQALSMVAQQMITDENLVVLYTGPEKEGIATPSAEALKAVIDEVKASDIQPNEDVAVAAEFLDPATLQGAAVQTAGKTVYDAVEWTLANGAKVIVYPTEYTKDQILFNLYKDGGRSLIATEDIASFDDNIFSLFLRNSGIAGFSGTEVSKMLTGKSIGFSPYIGNFDQGISGSSTQKDLETALQMLYLQFVHPRFDQDEYDNGINQLKAILPNVVNQPNFRFSQELYKTLYGNNPRRQLISEETIEKANLATIERYFRYLFNDAAGLTFVVVGDVDVDTLKPLVEKYIGSIPAGKAPLSWTDPHEEYVKGQVLSDITMSMQTPKSTVIQVYSAYLPYSPEKRAALDAAYYILDMRYTTSLREEEGGVYSPSVSGRFTRKPQQKAMIQTYFDCNPEMCDKLRDLAKEGFRDLAENGPTDEEVSMAILNLKKNIPENRVSNAYWRGCIETYLEYGEDSDALREAAVNALTKEQIQGITKELLDAGNLVEVVLRPESHEEASN